MIDPDARTGFGPLSREGLVQRVANLLAEAIIAGRLKPGERLSESAIARDMGLSRAPVREAARLLESSGLVDYRANRGFFVHAVSPEALDDLYELRICIETAAALRLVRHGAAAALPRLRAQIEALHAVARDETDLMGHIEADMAFHKLICECSGNARFLSVFEQIANETKLSLMVIGRIYDDPHRMADTHQPIVDAIASGDSDRTAQAVAYHIGTARTLVTDQFRTIQKAQSR